MLDGVEDAFNSAVAQVAALWLHFWQRHAEDEIFSRPYWC